MSTNILRISGGKFINKKLKVARESKPVMERVKNAIFSILKDKVLNAECLDLYAGSGNLGLEAISRGAKFCTFVEESYFATQIIEENIKNVITDSSIIPNLSIIKGDSVKHIANEERYYDIVFIDPPYGTPIKHILKFLHEILKTDGIAIYLHDKNTIIDETVNNKIKLKESRQYGITRVDIISRVE